MAYNNKIYPLMTNIIHPRISAGPAFPGVEDVFGESPVIAYLINANGQWVLVDTGACDPEWSAVYHHKMTKTEDMYWDRLLAPFGLTPESIEILVNTHLHWDHCYNNHLFPNAKIYVQQKEIDFAKNPIPSHYVFYEAEQMGLVPPWIKTANQFEIIDGRYTLLDGVHLIPLPGHTPGFQGILVETEDGDYLIAGDCVDKMNNWNNKKFGLPVPSPIHTDLVVYYQTLQEMMQMNAKILPGHDMYAFESNVYPKS